ncbi:MAG: glycine betaine ABC transporter substrate-binding protein [Actinomycetota bacterium]|nr:glycine betaine ABC transporter substrate-binding protein [Actinomycetota bacterium]
MSGGRGLRAVLVGLTLGAMGLLPAGCGFGEPARITLGYLSWDENVAVSNLTKVLLEGDLGYENVELRRAGDVVPAYRMVGRAEADAFQDTWMPNQREILREVEDNVELLDPWFKGTTRFGVVTPAYMNISSLGQLNETDAEHIIGIEPGTPMMERLPSAVIPEYGLEQQLVTADTEAMLAEVERRYRLREEFAFVAWEPHWMNEAYELDYLEDPKGALGTLTEPSDVSTLVREGLAEDDPVAYAFMDHMELTEAEVTGLQTEIREAGDPIKGAKIWLKDNRDVVEPWVEAAEKAREG